MEGQQHQGPPPGAAVLQILSGEWVAQCLKTAVLLGIPDLLKDGQAKTAKQLAEESKADPDFLERILRVLSSNGIFNEDPEKKLYSQNAESATLVSGGRGNSLALVKLLAHESHEKPWYTPNLVKCVQTGVDGFQLAYGEGSTFWSYMEDHPEARHVFWEAMESTSTMLHSAIVSTYDFSGFKKLVDIGGGYGTLLRKIMHKTPSLHGVLFDIPHVIEKATIKEDTELANRLELVGGDFFSSVPEGADAYISTTVLHDWNDEKAGQILDSIHRAAPPGAKLLLGETVVPSGTDRTLSKLMSVHMMVMCAGKERTAEEWTNLLNKHGFKLLRIIPTIPPMNLAIVEAERV